MTPYDAQLRECLNAILALGRRGPSSTDQWASYQQSLREQLDRLVERAMVQGIPRALAREALLALCLWADEVAMNQASAAAFWRINRLETYYFQGTDASFYAHLGALLRTPHSAVLRAYYLCLALGFEGQHHGPVGATARAALMAEIRPHLGTTPPMLTGSAWEHVPRTRTPWNAVWMPVAGLGVGLCLYLLLSVFVQRDAANYVSSIEALLQG